MLKKLRWRFVKTAMLALTIVLTLLMLLINGLSALFSLQRMDGLIDLIVQSGGEPRYVAGEEAKRPGPVDMTAETPFETRFFAAVVDEKGAVVKLMRDHMADLDEEQAQSLVDRLLAAGKTTGFIEQYRFRLTPLEDGEQLAVFLRATSEVRMLLMQLRISLIPFAYIWILMFVLVWLFSYRVVKPTADSIQQQKRFITDAEHELKTPLTIISGAADLLGEDVGEDNEWLTSIRGQVGRLSQLTAQLLSLSRLDEEASPMRQEIVNLSAVLREAAEPFAALAAAQGKLFDVQAAQEVRVLGDPALLSQLMTLLMDNAVRYAVGEGRIRAVLEREKRQAVLSVSNLCDMDEHQPLDRLFERFYRVESSRSRKTGGSGLGLSVAASIVQKHRGSIRAERPDAQSIRFVVCLPLMRER